MNDNKNENKNNQGKQSAKDYWGPRFWTFLHQICFSFPENPTSIEKLIYKQILVCFVKMIPCPSCQKHFIELLNKYPVDNSMTSRETLILWANTIHNKVNKRLGKPIIDLSEAKLIYINNKNGFNHKYLYQFLRYNFDRAIYNHTSSEHIIKLFKLLNIAYPCLKCRDTYKAFYQRKPLEKSLGTIKQFIEWYQLIFKPSNITEHLTKTWKKKI
jgi:hypothetical protein